VSAVAVSEGRLNGYASSGVRTLDKVRVRWWDRAEARVFLLCLGLNLAAAQILGYQWQIGNADAITRTANAAYVLFSRDPHAAAVGFVWPILPSLVQLPILPLMRLIGYPEAAGFVVSAVAGAAVVAALYRLLGNFGVRGWVRLLWLACVQLHAHFWYLSATGVAEVPMMLVIVLLVLAMMRPVSDQLRLIMAGGVLAVGVLIRYEALAFVAAIPLVLVIEQWPLRPLRASWSILEARMVSILAPPIYTVVLWLVMNWMIMGDPLYFQRSVFSLASAPDVARNVGPSHPLFLAMGSLPNTLEYVLRRITQANLALPALWVTTVALGLMRGNRRLLCLAVLTGCIFLLTGFQVYSGTLPSLQRYWGYATPLAVILAGACLPVIASASRRGGMVFCGIASLLLIGAVVNSPVQLGAADGGVDERRFSDRLLGKLQDERELRVEDSDWVRQQDSRKLAAALDYYSAQGPTVIDTETGFNGILEAEHPERLIVSSDRDFARALDAPERYIRYIFVTDPTIGGSRDLINQHYPSLFAAGGAWVQRVDQVQGTIKPWRVYEVLDSPYPEDDASASDTVAAAPTTSDTPLSVVAPEVDSPPPVPSPVESSDNDVALMPPPNTRLPSLFAAAPVVLSKDADLGEDATVFALVNPVRVVGLASVGCWSGPDATPDEASQAVLFGRADAGTEFEVYLIRGARAYAYDVQTANYCWIDIGAN
jgi:hypothetical protein